MKRIALFFDRSYIDAHFCFTELARQLVKNGFLVDLYYIANPYNPPPVFFDSRIRIFNFPLTKFQKADFWIKNNFYKNNKYCATFGTPVKGAWLAYKVAKKHKIPFFYLADEIIDPQNKFFKGIDYEKDKQKDLLANRSATATIALSEKRFQYQKKVNGLSDRHKYFIIPNAPAGKAKKLKSNYFRDIFEIEDDKPIILFIGTIYWSLAKKIFEMTRNYTDKPYHIIFHGRTKGQMGNEKHPFIKISDTPLPSYLLNYAVSSADIGLVLYNQDNEGERENGETGGKIATYLKNKLPLIAGNLHIFKQFEDQEIAVFWNGKDDIDLIIRKILEKRMRLAENIEKFYAENFNYELYFNRFLKFLNEHI